jgi:hypothetical protein
MKNEFTAIIENDGEWYIGYCPRFPGQTARDARMKNAAPALRMQ